MSESNIPNLARLRKARGLSVDDLGKIIEVHGRTIRRWEAGEGDPNLSDLRRLAAYFKISVAVLIGERARPDTEPST